MQNIKQFIVFTITTDPKNPVIVCTSRQYTKDLAISDVWHKLEGKYVIKRTYTQEIRIDEDGVVRMVDDNGEVVPMYSLNLN